jgi:hypothetical protein
MHEETSSGELRNAAVVFGLAAGFLWMVQRGQFMSQEDAGSETPGETGGDEGVED